MRFRPGFHPGKFERDQDLDRHGSAQEPLSAAAVRATPGSESARLCPLPARGQPHRHRLRNPSMLSRTTGQQPGFGSLRRSASRWIQARQLPGNSKRRGNGEGREPRPIDTAFPPGYPKIAWFGIRWRPHRRPHFACRRWLLERFRDHGRKSRDSRTQAERHSNELNSCSSAFLHESFSNFGLQCLMHGFEWVATRFHKFFRCLWKTSAEIGQPRNASPVGALQVRRKFVRTWSKLRLTEPAD